MKLKALMLSAVLFLTPTAALAEWNFGHGHFGGFFQRIFTYFQVHRDWHTGDYDGHQNPVPEPSGALVMGVGLTVAALARRRNRN